MNCWCCWNPCRVFFLSSSMFMYPLYLSHPGPSQAVVDSNSQTISNVFTGNQRSFPRIHLWNHKGNLQLQHMIYFSNLGLIIFNSWVDIYGQKLSFLFLFFFLAWFSLNLDGFRAKLVITEVDVIMERLSNRDSLSKEWKATAYVDHADELGDQRVSL